MTCHRFLFYCVSLLHGSVYILASIVLCPGMLLVNALHEEHCLLVVLIPLTSSVALDSKCGLHLEKKKNGSTFHGIFRSYRVLYVLLYLEMQSDVHFEDCKIMFISVCALCNFPGTLPHNLL